MAHDAASLGASLEAQSAADVLREVAGADGAFLAAGLLRDKFDAADATSLFQFPSDEIVVLRLTGAQIRQAFERSVSLFPQPNSGFLQISGFSATFSRSAPNGRRIQDISFDGGRFSDGESYTIAMPSSLGRGGMGFFRIWDKPNIERMLPDLTLQKVFQGRRLSTSGVARWTAVD